jgi:hypothetical protein
MPTRSPKLDLGAPRPTVLLVMYGVVGVLTAATLLLWAHYGTAVFFETIRAGFSACFG